MAKSAFIPLTVGKQNVTIELLTNRSRYEPHTTTYHALAAGFGATKMNVYQTPEAATDAVREVVRQKLKAQRRNHMTAIPAAKGPLCPVCYEPRLPTKVVCAKCEARGIQVKGLGKNAHLLDDTGAVLTTFCKECDGPTEILNDDALCSDCAGNKTSEGENGNRPPNPKPAPKPLSPALAERRAKIAQAHQLLDRRQDKDALLADFRTAHQIASKAIENWTGPQLDQFLNLLITYARHEPPTPELDNDDPALKAVLCRKIHHTLDYIQTNQDPAIAAQCCNHANRALKTAGASYFKDLPNQQLDKLLKELEPWMQNKPVQPAPPATDTEPTAGSPSPSEEPSSSATTAPTTRPSFKPALPSTDGTDPAGSGSPSTSPPAASSTEIPTDPANVTPAHDRCGIFSAHPSENPQSENTAPTNPAFGGTQPKELREGSDDDQPGESPVESHPTKSEPTTATPAGEPSTAPVPDPKPTAPPVESPSAPATNGLKRDRNRPTKEGLRDLAAAFLLHAIQAENKAIDCDTKMERAKSIGEAHAYRDAALMLADDFDL